MHVGGMQFAGNEMFTIMLILFLEHETINKTKDIEMLGQFSQGLRSPTGVRMPERIQWKR
jgi:hypothetical protein